MMFDAPPTPRRGARAFTLVEMLISMTIVTVIVAACGSVIVLASKSMAGGSASSTSSRSLIARRASDQITSELATALVVSSSSANSITFTVPPRNGDVLPETIAYSWAGAGQSIMRQYNGGAAVSIADGIQSFNLSYLTKAAALPPVVESAEQLLASYTGASNGSTALSTTSWECQYFNPATLMTGNTVSWKITRVQLLLKRKSLASLGNIVAQIRAADAAMKPTGAVLASSTVLVTLIPLSNTWVDMPLATALGNLTPSTGMTLDVVSSTTTSNGTVLGTVGISPTSVNMSECYTTNAGTSWTTPDITIAVCFRVYGTLTTQP